jgi:protocatechuate 3,4-dioxygenase beta subunit
MRGLSRPDDDGASLHRGIAIFTSESATIGGDKEGAAVATADIPDVNPPYLFPAYQASVKRAPSKRLVALPKGWFDLARGPVYGRIPIGPNDNDLTNQHEGRPIGQRILVSGRVVDSDGRGVPDTLVEIWQTNASGAYVDAADPGFVPLDPNFTGAGRTITDSSGRYWFRTIKPAPYLGARGSWFRPAHIHVSLFSPNLGRRLITQCYFEGDPHIARDPIVQSIPDPRGIERLIARFDPENTENDGLDSAVAYDWDIVLRGSRATPMED